MPPYQLSPSGDHAITIDWGSVINLETNSWVLAVFYYLQQNPVPGVIDIIPAYSTVTLVYDIVAIKKKAAGSTAYTYMESVLSEILPVISLAGTKKTAHIRVPVCYDVSMGPDLAGLAALHRMSIDDVIKIHSAGTYRVFMLGFLPGFAYMGSVDPRIATPRLQQPRTLVPAGSVGIAGAQTGIYPVASPGGWQLIGQTPLCLFNPGRQKPCLFAPGDEVTFFPITRAEFEKMKQ